MRIATALFMVMCARLGSLNALEETLKKAPKRSRARGWIGGDVPSADRLGEVAQLMDIDSVRRALYAHHYKRKRNKTLRPLPGNLRVLILDGHEMCASYLRCRPQCLKREITVHDEKRTQYYHRYVAAYLLCKGERLMLDLEMLGPGEGEIAAALRLLERLLLACPRAFNLVAGDALYLDPTLCRRILDARKDFIAVLKNENRELIQDFRGLTAPETATATATTIQRNGRECLCYDIEGFDSWTQLGSQARVVSSRETWKIRRQRTKQEEVESVEWLWATSLSQEKAATAMLVCIGHRRWDMENCGFNELVNQWHADHVYHHVPNAMAVMLLLLFLAYNLFHVWFARALKPELREGHTTQHFAKLISAAFHRPMPDPP